MGRCEREGEKLGDQEEPHRAGLWGPLSKNKNNSYSCGQVALISFCFKLWRSFLFKIKKKNSVKHKYIEQLRVELEGPRWGRDLLSCAIARGRGAAGAIETSKSNCRSGKNLTLEDIPGSDSPFTDPEAKI